MNVLHKADASNRSKVLAAAMKIGNWQQWVVGGTNTSHTTLSTCHLTSSAGNGRKAKGIRDGWVEKCLCSAPNVLQQLKHVACWMLDVCARQMQLKRLNSLSLKRGVPYMGGMCTLFSEPVF